MSRIPAWMLAPRKLRISFTASEENVGPILANLADKAQDLSFEVIDEVPWHVNKPRKAKAVPTGAAPTGNGYVPPPSRARHKIERSNMPAIFKERLAELKKNKQPLTTLQARKILEANKMAPASFSYALVVLQRAGLIKCTKPGEYEVI